MITLDLIQSTFDKEIQLVVELIDRSKWHTQPNDTIELFFNKTMLGQVKSSGKVLINESFIGLTDIALLKNTLRQEIAHLIVGLHNNHNNRFKRVAAYLGVKKNSCFDLSFIQNKIGFKYAVSATLVTGEVVSLGGVHRKTRRYTDYTPSDKRWDSINGTKVTQYHFSLL